MNKENINHKNKDFELTSSVLDGINRLDSQYQKSYKESLKSWQQVVQEFDHMSSADSVERHIYDDALFEIEQIQTVFFLHQALSEFGYDKLGLFLSLAHTLDYYGSVLVPMKKLVEEDKTQEAIDLFKKPRRYWR